MILSNLKISISFTYAKILEHKNSIGFQFLKKKN